MAKITTNNSGPFKDKNGYSKVGGLLKSTATKADLQKTQTRANKFTPEQNKQVDKALKVNTTPAKRAAINYDLPNGGGGGLPKDGDYKSAAVVKKSPRYRVK